ncbi:unnamed protein product [marine sediment metagenome]|uniref:Uncharacterized protein n=1 Tax=marine sediment metagenome TaxID=412755 RepID=X0Y227_9ZZZZ
MLKKLKITERKLKKLSDEEFVEALRLIMHEWWRRTILKLAE